MNTPPLPVPAVESDEPVAVIPAASVAPLDGPPDGERINIYTVAPIRRHEPLGEIREYAVRKPFAATLVAFALGYVAGRVLR